MIKLHSGRIAAATSDTGRLYLKLSGDVRVTLCTSLAQCIDTLLDQVSGRGLTVDLLDVEHLDSTTMGLLARLGIQCQGRLSLTPVIWCVDHYRSQLAAMSLDEVFAIKSVVPERAGRLARKLRFQTLPVPSAAGEEEIAEQVLEAHRALLMLNPEKEESFSLLMQSLRRYVENSTLSTSR